MAVRAMHMVLSHLVELVQEAESFLNGKSQAVQNGIKAEMTKASDAMDFEAAAKLRDRLKAMSHIQSSQGVNPSTFDEADLFAFDPTRLHKLGHVDATHRSARVSVQMQVRVRMTTSKNRER